MFKVLNWLLKDKNQHLARQKEMSQTEIKSRYYN
jgi:hypothetical protein